MAERPRDRGAHGFEVGLTLVLVAVGVWCLWLRFNAAPGQLSGEAFKMAFYGDLIAYYLPMTELAAGRLAHLELPLWNPHICSGIPLLATLQTGVFFPATWLAVWLPAHSAISWSMAFACFAGGWLAAAAFRALGHGWVPSAAGGVLYVFACVLGQVLWPPAAWSLALVPALLLCVAKCLARPERPLPLSWWCALAGTVALQLLAGFPQYAVYGFLVVAGFAAVRLLEGLRGGGLGPGAVAARGAALGAAVLLGAALAAIQLAPTVELATLGERLAGKTAADLQYLTVLAPYTSTDVVRAAFDPSPRLVGFHLGRGGYLGMVTLLLAGVAVGRGWRSGRTWLWLGLGGAALALSDGFFGLAAPLYRAFLELPVLGTFRTPERLRAVAFFCVIALAVAGFDELRRAGEGGAASARTRVLVVSVALALTLGMLAAGHGAGSWRLAAGSGLALAVAWTGVPSVLRRGAGLALFGLLVVDLSLATGEYGSLREIPVKLSQRYAVPLQPGLPDGFFEAQRDALGPARIALPGYRPRMATAPSDGGYRVACYEPLAPAEEARLNRILTGRGAQGAALFDLDPEQAASFFDVAGVQRVIEPGQDGPHVRNNPDALPRAFVVSSYRVESQTQAFEHLRRGDFDFSRAVLLEQDPGLPTPPEAPVPPLVPARIESYEPERVVVDAEAPGPSLLVLSDSDYPGWRARVDGEAVPILRANGLYRAVPLRGGRHRVVFDYAPGSLRLGEAISAGALAVLAGVGIVCRRRQARRHERS